MDQLNRGGAFAGGGGDPFDRPVPDVSGGEDPGHAGFQQQRGAVQRPTRRCAAAAEQIPPGQDIAPVVERYGAGEPARAGLGPDEDEQRRRGNRAALAAVLVANGQRFQPAVGGGSITSVCSRTRMVGVPEMAVTR